MSSNAGAVQRYRPSRIKEERKMKKYSEDFLKYGAIGTYYGGSAFVGLKVFAVDEHDYKVQFMCSTTASPIAA